MSRRFIQIDLDLCKKCNACHEVCEWFKASSGQYGTTVHRPAYLYCIYCKGDCTQVCPEGAIMFVDNSGPHTILCRSKNINNFMEE